jgi:DNA-binding CsgD family transcriptional regulator
MTCDFLSEHEWTRLFCELRLSPREQLIAFHLLRGLTERQAAQLVGISPHTVHTHLRNLYRKLGIGGRADLVLRLFEAYVENVRDHSPVQVSPIR